MYLNVLLANKEGLVSEETISKSVERLITTRMKLGMFDDEVKVPYASIPYEENDSREHREFALRVSEKTMALLKNENYILPINKDNINSIAVIGPNANSRDALTGNYFGTSSKYELKGIKKINLKPGQERQLEVELTPRQMALIDNDGNCILEPGVFEVFVGGSQPDDRSAELTGTVVKKCFFEVKRETLQLEY
ncbi:fibronectin type III-like domain-contianing protein [Clostridium estertheticum]|uniref:fibronectin type III-like domain-contianing protein n=1 Tax=Clostridium estertheticum TaxID=238834 RepID=UPI001C0BDC32|nr:fibronectin type III-like domain-contianing protein [Clostridium estertheticum]MBU3073478.1 fibronectin type III-like domain-contianing protein [Clostridium estertheticum]MBU3163281.1 fibronectin type III-like domain-contianing protein [Clostridium estertheticum]